VAQTATPDSFWKEKKLFPVHLSSSAPIFVAIVIHAVFLGLFSQGILRSLPVRPSENPSTRFLGIPGHQRSLPKLSVFYFPILIQRNNRHGDERGEVK
jgi:hypothetical protein